MDRLLQLATNAPVIFTLIVVVVSYVLMTAAFMVRMLAGENVGRQHILQTVALVAIALIFAFILWRFGWVEGPHTV
jgi:hypothetical protein